jgi:PilZ domain
MERRKCRRYSVCVEIEILETGGRAPSRGNTTDVSLGGCYVATIFPLPIGAAIEFTMWIGDDKIRGRGSVQTSHRGVGMGIKFTDLAREAIGRLDAYLHAAFSAPAEEALQAYIR